MSLVWCGLFLIAELFAAVYLLLFYGVWYEFVWVGCGGDVSGLF